MKVLSTVILWLEYHTSGVVLCAEYLGSVTGQKVADIVNDHFENAFSMSVSPRGRRVLMDGCPRQHSKLACKAFDARNAKIFKIPARSPDSNPLENFFHTIKEVLKTEARTNKIIKETMEQFRERACKAILRYPCSKIDKIIESMDKRVTMVLESEGRRIKY